MATKSFTSKTQVMDAEFNSKIGELSGEDKSLLLLVMGHIATVGEARLDKDPILKLSPQQSREYWQNELAKTDGKFTQLNGQLKM